MKHFSYLLILLLISAQVDDAWVVVPASPSAPLADDDAEYLTVPRLVREERASRGREPIFVSLKRQTPDFPLFRGGVPSAWNPTTPFAPPPLCVFMSLQI